MHYFTVDEGEQVCEQTGRPFDEDGDCCLSANGAQLPRVGQRVHVRGASGVEEKGTCTALRDMSAGGDPVWQVDLRMDDGTLYWFPEDALVCDAGCDCLEPEDAGEPTCGECGRVMFGDVEHGDPCSRDCARRAAAEALA